MIPSELSLATGSAPLDDNDINVNETELHGRILMGCDDVNYGA